jgi:hypothetical protein
MRLAGPPRLPVSRPIGRRLTRAPALGFDSLGPADPSATATARAALAALDALLVLDGPLFVGDGPGAAAASLVRAAAAAPRGDVRRPAAALAASLAARATSPGWPAFLADAIVVGRNNPLAAAAARGDAARAPARAAVAADLALLPALAFNGADAVGWAASCGGGVPRPGPEWGAALAAVVDGEPAAGACARFPADAPPPPPACLGPPLTRGERAALAARLTATGDAGWDSHLPWLEAVWAAAGAGNVGTTALFEWDGGRLLPSADDAAPGGARASADPWAPLAAALAAWASDPAADAPFAGGARVAVEPAAPGGGPTLWASVRAAPTLLTSGARLVRVPGGPGVDWRALGAALRSHPRARWVAVCDGAGADAGADAALRGSLPPHAVLVATLGPAAAGAELAGAWREG